MGERIELTAGERSVPAYRAAPEAGGPGVLVLHAWWGMTEMFTGLCDRLADNGFVALVPDMYDGRTAGTIEEAEALSGTLRWTDARERMSAAISSLLRDRDVRGERLGGIGFSMGAAFLMAMLKTNPALAAAVVFYGGSEGNDDLAEHTSAAILGHFAEADEWEPPVQDALRLADRLRAAGLDVTFHVYPGTGHWFFEENRPDAYNNEAAHIAWERTLRFLRQQLHSSSDGASSRS